MRQAILLSLLAGAVATSVGALPALLFRGALAPRLRSALDAFGAGIMLAASIFSLAVPALRAATEQMGNRLTAALLAALAFSAGGAVFGVLNVVLPHEHVERGVRVRARAGARRAWLFVLAITIHNLPEGLAVGVAGAATPGTLGRSVAIAIGIQNVPEGLVVATSLLGAGYGRWPAVGVGVLSGLVEPVGAIIGAAAVVASRTSLPYALVFAAGAMVYVIVEEVVPEAHAGLHGGSATWAFMGGFSLMMVLDAGLG